MSTPGVRFQDPSLGNSSPWVYVWAMWALVACTSLVGMRLWVRKSRFGLDDALNTLGYLFAVASCAVILRSLQGGLGAPVVNDNDQQCSAVARLVITSVCLLLISDGLSKCATIALVRRIVLSGTTLMRVHRAIILAALVVASAWAVLALALIGTGCTHSCAPERRLVHACTSKNDGIVAVISLGVIVELMIFGVAAYFFASLQMAWGMKVTTISLFAIRLPIIPFSIIFISSYKNYISNVDDGLPDLGKGIYWQFALLIWTTISPCLQALKSTADIMSTSGAQVDTSKSSSAGRSYRLQALWSMSASLRKQSTRGDMSWPMSTRFIDNTGGAMPAQSSGPRDEMNIDGIMAESAIDASTDRLVMGQPKAWDLSSSSR